MPIKEEKKISKTWIGSDYGGFYVYTDILNSDSVIYSFGIGTDISFDLAMIEKFNCNVFGFDPTPKSISWIKSRGILKNFHFLPYGIEKETSIKYFFLPKKESYISGSVINHNDVNDYDRIEVPMKCFRDILTELKHSSVDIIKMDIEGSEFTVIPEIVKSGIKASQLLIEFHHRFLKDGKSQMLKTLDFLKENGYEIFGISDSQEEISLIRKDSLKS